MPVDDGLVVDVLAQNEVRVKQPAVRLGESAGVIEPRPLRGRQSPSALRYPPGPARLTAISISGPAARVTLKSATEVAPLLKRVARDIASEFDKEAAG
ncbi:hypothetical protein [Mycobacterium interjectum]|uniref:hypothetical protein n=1 Tax=Mycobacterium interjectum TaxID=33895 RepID=UPI0008360C2D